MLERFVFYGMTGWAMEILWTGFHSFLKKDYSLKGTSYIWMFPIYGMVIFFEPLCVLLFNLPMAIRGGVYMILIFAIEYASGWGLKKALGVCPWDYGNNKYSIHGLIRLDYAPLWFAVGIFYEGLYYYAASL